MRAISIRQPWAWCIVNGYKDVENRDWATKHRGEILIHAAKFVDLAGYKFIEENFPEIFAIMPGYKDIERGGVVGKATIMDCIEKSLSLWFFGKYGFQLENAEPLPFIPYSGQLGFFTIPYGEIA